MRITSRGQITIPHYIRERAGLLPNTEVELVLEGDTVRIVKVDDARKPTRGTAAVRLLRQNADRVSMTTDDIMALTRGD